MRLPLIHIQLDNDLYGLPNQGSLVYEYLPFQNLLMTDPEEVSLGSLQLSAEKAGINIGYPLTIEVEPAYDDSINLIITDEVNPPKIVNSRFYQTSTMTYEIADRKGNLDTNIYSEDNFKIEASLVKTTRTIMSIDFLGISSGGKLPVGTYTLYLKLADADGNETDFIAESSRILCHIGGVNSPASIRGGQQNEDSEKIITCRVNNLDLAYDYIHVYYTRATGDGTQEFTKAYKIHDKYKITNNATVITITGYENHEEIGLEDINIQLTNFDSVKTITNCQNISFVGNITNSYDLFRTLEKYSLFITPQVAFDGVGIGNLNSTYKEQFQPDTGYEYYNVKNVYYKLSYWDQEIYRVGIVYILPDYTLSPVFNIRGIKRLTKASNDPASMGFTTFSIDETIDITENFLIEKSLSKSDLNWENSKGVFKIDMESLEMFKPNQSIKPIGLKFYFPDALINGNETFEGLKNLTRGFFFVRQKRIPTILAQGVGIGTSTLTGIPTPLVSSSAKGFFNKYIGQSFLSLIGGYQQLKPSFFAIPKVTSNALICPDASVRKQLLGTFFNSSEYTLYTNKYKANFKAFNDLNSLNSFTYKWLTPITDLDQHEFKSSEVTLIEPGISGIRNSKYTFSSKAGDATIVHKHLDPVLGDYEDPTNTNDTWNDTASKVRGEFNTFLGLTAEIQPGQYYNIFQKGYNFEQSWQNYFLVRYNDASPFYPISDKTSWEDITSITPLYFRGDCYINTYSHRMNWNFIDPDLPTNKKIVDPFCWATNFRIKRKASTVVDADGEIVTTEQTLVYNKLLDIFTYKDISYPDARKDDGTSISDEEGEGALVIVPTGLIEPDGKKFKKYSEINGLFGTNKINRPDVNAVPLGYWLTFKICSNVNLAMRDLDWTRPMEEALHKQKRGFYPLQAMDPSNPLPESDVINNGISQSVGHKHYFEIPDVPFIKTNFATRIYYSNLLQNALFTNGNRVFQSNNYQDYSREYGALVKLIEWYGTLIGIMEHGIIMIPVNERALMNNASGENVYINTDNVLPKNPKVLSNTFGSFWPESVIKTPQFIYGIDTVAKKIWRTNSEQFEVISDLKIQKFLNDNIKLLEIEKDRTVGINSVKTHYNAFKQDVLFVFNYSGKQWHLCWNEILNKWVTQYTWFPEFSENINNIFYTFANQANHEMAGNRLYKHGFAGVEEELGNILPTKWYDQQFPFEYEFIIADLPGVQKIYENLQLISNLAEPDSFYFEVVGEGFDWNKQKELIRKLNDVTIPIINTTTLTTDVIENRDEELVQLRYKEYLVDNPTLKKLPYIYLQSFDVNDPNSFYRDRGELTIPFSLSTIRDLSLRHHNKLKENLVDVYQKGVDITKYGNLKGNMQYLEDSWRVQIQPISFTYAYVVREVVIGEGDAPEENWILKFSKLMDMHIRDKYLKVRVKYSGTQYAIINAVRTLYTVSYA